jgi:hypothetical protein
MTYIQQLWPSVFYALNITISSCNLDEASGPELLDCLLISYLSRLAYNLISRQL